MTRAYASESEKRFWDKILRAPEDERETAGSGNDDEMDVYIYVVDTGAPWVAAYGTAHANLLDVKEAVMAGAPHGNRPAATLAAAILQASAAMAGPLTDAGIACFAAAMNFICASRSWVEVSRQTGSLRGHWLAMLYRLNNDDFLMQLDFDRPEVFAPGLLELPQLRDLVRMAVDRDEGGDGGAISERVRASGGIKAHPLWR